MNRALLFAVCVSSFAAVSCGSNPEFAEQPAPSASVPPTAAVPPPPASGSAATTTPVVATSAAPTSPNCDGVQTLSITGMLQVRATSHAPQMKPEGGLVCGTAAEGQTVTGPVFMLEPGHCYTILAQSLPPVQEVDVQLIADPTASGSPQLAALLGKPLLAVDTETGVQGSIGSKQNCFQWALPLPVPVKVEVKSRTGAGTVAAQVYKKKKAVQ